MLVCTDYVRSLKFGTQERICPQPDLPVYFVQYKTIEPWLQKDEEAVAGKAVDPDGTVKENLQVRTRVHERMRSVFTLLAGTSHQCFSSCCHVRERTSGLSCQKEEDAFEFRVCARLILNILQSRYVSCSREHDTCDRTCVCAREEAEIIRPW